MNKQSYDAFNGLTQLFVIGILISVLLFQDLELSLPICTLLIASLFILVNRMGSAPLLVAFQTLLFMREPPRHSPNLFGSCVFVIIVLTLLMYLDRNRSLKRFFKLGIWEIFRALFNWRDEPPSLRMATESSEFRNDQLFRKPSAAEADPHDWILQPVLILACCVLTSQFALIAMPFLDEFSKRDPSSMVMINTLAAMPLLAVVMLGFVVLASSFSWRRLTATQASLYVKTTMANLLYPDLRLIAKRQLATQQRRRRSLAELINVDEHEPEISDIRSAPDPNSRLSSDTTRERSNATVGSVRTMDRDSLPIDSRNRAGQRGGQHDSHEISTTDHKQESQRSNAIIDSLRRLKENTQHRDE